MNNKPAPSSPKPSGIKQSNTQAWLDQYNRLIEIAYTAYLSREFVDGLDALTLLAAHCSGRLSPDALSSVDADLQEVIRLTKEYRVDRSRVYHATHKKEFKAKYYARVAPVYLRMLRSFQSSISRDEAGR